jgi:hypothetical protein
LASSLAVGLRRTDVVTRTTGFVFAHSPLLTTVLLMGDGAGCINNSQARSNRSRPTRIAPLLPTTTIPPAPPLVHPRMVSTRRPPSPDPQPTNVTVSDPPAAVGGRTAVPLVAMGGGTGEGMVAGGFGRGGLGISIGGWGCEGISLAPPLKSNDQLSFCSGTSNSDIGAGTLSLFSTGHAKSGSADGLFVSNGADCSTFGDAKFGWETGSPRSSFRDGMMGSGFSGGGVGSWGWGGVVGAGRGRCGVCGGVGSGEGKRMANFGDRRAASGDAPGEKLTENRGTPDSAGCAGWWWL